MFRVLFISFVLDEFLQANCFEMFCSKNSIIFENMHLLSCLFPCADKVFSDKFHDWNFIYLLYNFKLYNY